MLLGQSGIEGSANVVGIVAVACNHVPAPGLVFCSSILFHHHIGRSGKLDVVGVVEHNQVVEAQQTGNSACALRNFFLNTAVGNVGIYLVLHRGVSQTSLEEFLGHSRAGAKGMPLA